MKFFSCLTAVTLMLTSMFSSCGSKDEAAAGSTKVGDTVSPNPFPFYKNVEVRPGLSFEIVTWGKGADSIGGYTILLSDSLKNNYKAVAATRNTVFKDAWNMDMDTDGNPELYIQLLKNKSESDLIVYEFYDNEFHKITFPSLSARIRKIYKGNDKFFIKNGELLRSIPVADSAGKTVIQTYRYILQNNAFEIKTVKEQ